MPTTNPALSPRRQPIGIAYWRPGRGSGAPSPREIVEEFIWATESLPDEQVAAIAGVAEATAQQWRRGLYQHTTGKMLTRLLHVLAGEEIPVREAAAVPRPQSPARADRR